MAPFGHSAVSFKINYPNFLFLTIRRSIVPFIMALLIIGSRTEWNLRQSIGGKKNVFRRLIQKGLH